MQDVPYIRSLLRGESAPGQRSLGLFLLATAFGLFYGAAMGTFSGVTGQRLLQITYSAIKVPILLLVTFLLALPGFWVLNRLMGLASDFPQVLRGLLGAQAALTAILASLAPFTLLWYASSADYSGAILFNGLMFAVASASAQILLKRSYLPLERSNPHHRNMRRLWLLLYAFVGIQMGWTLRPFIGDPSAPVQFFREGAVSNAYVVVFKLVWTALRGLF